MNIKKIGLILIVIAITIVAIPVIAFLYSLYLIISGVLVFLGIPVILIIALGLFIYYIKTEDNDK